MLIFSSLCSLILSECAFVLFQPSPFFTEQLTAFEVWLDHGSEHKKPPEQLPIVLQVLYFFLFLLAVGAIVWLPFLFYGNFKILVGYMLNNFTILSPQLSKLIVNGKVDKCSFRITAAHWHSY